MIPVHLRNTPDPLETYDHKSIIEHFAKWIKPENYLEIGVRTGYTLIPISGYCKNCYAVDINFTHKNYAKNVFLYEMKSDDFFEKIESSLKFDMVFIDGDHSKEQVYKDFLNVKDRVIDDGFIFFHDSYPYAEYMLNPDLCNNCWEAILSIKQMFYKEWEILTLPFNPGLTIMKKMKIEKQLLWK